MMKMMRVMILIIAIYCGPTLCWALCKICLTCTEVPIGVKLVTWVLSASLNRWGLWGLERLCNLHNAYKKMIYLKLKATHPTLYSGLQTVRYVSLPLNKDCIPWYGWVMMWLYCSLLLGNVRSMWVHVAAQAEKTTLQNNDFVWFLVSSQGTHLLSFFTFSICFKCWMTIEWLTLSSWATSHVVVRGSLSFDDCQPLCSSSSKLLSPLHKLLEPPLHCIFISSSWTKCVVDVVSCPHCFMIHFELK